MFRNPIPALVTTLRAGLVRALSGNATDYLDGTGNWSVPSGGGADPNLTYLTELDETSDLPNSLQVLAGDGIDFDDSTPNQRVIQAKVDGVTIDFNGSGELETVSSGGGGAYTKIEEKTPSGVGTITFSSLGSYTHLELIWTARGTELAASTNLEIQFNGDTGSNYYRQLIAANNTGVAASQNLGASSATIGSATAANGPAGLVGGGTVKLFDYRGSTFVKIGITEDALFRNTTSANTFVRQFTIGWNSTSPITSITLSLVSGDFVAGSKFSLYGIQ